MPNKIVALILSIVISGAGLLYLGGSKYTKKFLISFILGFVFIGWVLGLYWTITAEEFQNA